jgi:hypothetical protein
MFFLSQTLRNSLGLAAPFVSCRRWIPSPSSVHVAFRKSTDCTDVTLVSGSVLRCREGGSDAKERECAPKRPRVGLLALRGSSGASRAFRRLLLVFGLLSSLLLVSSTRRRRPPAFEKEDRRLGVAQSRCCSRFRDRKVRRMEVMRRGRAGCILLSNPPTSRTAAGFARGRRRARRERSQRRLVLRAG